MNELDRSVNYIGADNVDDYIAIFTNHPQRCIKMSSCRKQLSRFGSPDLLKNIVKLIDKKTGLFFDKQTTKSLTHVLEKFNPKEFKKSDCIKQAQQFSTQNFMLNFKQEIDQLWQQHQITIL